MHVEITKILRRMKCLARCVCEWPSSCSGPSAWLAVRTWKSPGTCSGHAGCCCSFSRCLPGCGTWYRGAGAAGGRAAQHCSLSKCSSHDMPENLQYYNNANKNGKLWVLYRCIKKCNFSVTWITLPTAAPAPLKEACSPMVLCVPLNIFLSGYFKDGNNRREFNGGGGLYLEGQVGFPPSHPSHSIEGCDLKWEVILLMTKIKR